MATKKTTTHRKTTYTITETHTLRAISYFALVIAAFMFLFGGIFGKVGAILNLIGQICVLIGIGLPAYNFSRTKSTAWRVIFWIALAVYVFGCIFGVIHSAA